MTCYGNIFSSAKTIRKKTIKPSRNSQQEPWKTGMNVLRLLNKFANENVSFSHFDEKQKHSKGSRNFLRFACFGRNEIASDNHF